MASSSSGTSSGRTARRPIADRSPLSNVTAPPSGATSDRNTLESGHLPLCCDGSAAPAARSTTSTTPAPAPNRGSSTTTRNEVAAKTRRPLLREGVRCRALALTTVLNFSFVFQGYAWVCLVFLFVLLVIWNALDPSSRRISPSFGADAARATCPQSLDERIVPSPTPDF